MRAIAEDYEDKYGKDCGDVVRSSFFVKNSLQSVLTVSGAVDLINRPCGLQKDGLIEQICLVIIGSTQQSQPLPRLRQSLKNLY